MQTRGLVKHPTHRCTTPRHARLFELIRQQNLGAGHLPRPDGVKQDALADSVAQSLRDAARQSLQAML